ncbi:MAG: CRTAC1 family protein [Planctomycetes bacterium]|nr:CRTAC1 family protein [Planctomycetota bacterium]
MKHVRVAVVAASLAVAGCSERGAQAEGPQNETHPAGATQPSTSKLEFVDVAAAAGIDVVVECGDPRRWYILESNGSGAAWLDYDADGDQDLFVANGAKCVYVDDGKRIELAKSWNGARLYRNDGKLRFTDVSREALPALAIDLQNGVATGDVDDDGDTDLYLANFGRDVLLVNQGGKFVDGTAAAGLGCELYGASAAFGDVDNDGDLDLYVANYVEFDLAKPPLDGKRAVHEGVEVGWGPVQENKQGFNVGARDVFYLNDGHGRFTDATASAGLELPTALCSYAVVFSDVDRDGWQDILVANDIEPCNLFRNQGGGKFVEEGAVRGFALNADGKPTGAMGLSVEDFDGDGDMDVLRTNFDFEANSLHVNDGKGRFVDRAAAFGLAEPSMNVLGWGGGFFDADLDGDLDALVANGHVYPQAKEIGMSGWTMPTQLYECVTGANGAPTYRDVTSSAGPGLAPLTSARGIAFGDPDDDGDVDALVIDLDARPRLLENRSERRGRWLAVRTVGTASNRDGYGAVIQVEAGGKVWTREMRSTQGLYSSHDTRLSFGLGPVERVDKLVVRWPSGRRSELTDVALDRVVTVTEPEEIAR